MEEQTPRGSTVQYIQMASAPDQQLFVLLSQCSRETQFGKLGQIRIDSEHDLC